MIFEQVLNTPKELRNAVMQLFLVPRYTRIYHEGIFYDSSGVHTLRCVNRVNDLDISKRDRQLIQDILWCHDLPEIITSDFSVVEKLSDLNIERYLESIERKAVKKIMPEKYQRLYWSFVDAERFWRGLSYSKLPSPHALTAKVIDTADGNIFFHKALADWVSSKLYNPKYLPSENALKYSFLSYKKYLGCMNYPIKPFGPFEGIIFKLLNDQIIQISERWSGNDRIPEIIKKEIFDILL